MKNKVKQSPPNKCIMCKLSDQMLVFSLWPKLLYLVFWVRGVHDTAQLPACVNHNPHHCTCSEGEGEKKHLRSGLKKHTEHKHQLKNVNAINKSVFQSA